MGTKRRYTDEFKREAIRMADEGVPVRQLAVDLDVSEWTIRAWMKKARGTSATPTSGSKKLPVEEENRRLREENQAMLKRHGITGSMSRRGNCWDNAVVESFFGTLKTELVNHERYESRSEARGSIFEYIEMFYNRKRRHSALGYVSPVEFESKSA